ncbi:hypothetical protein APHAL10511_001887 [Amanita phalloides]|nr:hypothetical protein APHAL10511_001887 [Amanita phalloides]
MASSELLKQIQAGKRLKKADTNDRSAPLVDKSKVGGPDRSGIGGGLASVPLPAAGAGPPQLGNLFAGGIPKLKPAGQGNLAKPSTLGKPPAVPGRETAKATTPSPHTRSIPPQPVSNAPPKPPSTRPAPPNRPSPTVPPRAAPSIPVRPAASAPSIPARPAPSAPSVPRRPAPPTRAASPPAMPLRPSPPIPSRSNSPPMTKPTPSILPRSVSQTTSKTGSSTAGRAPPPPPPPRPSSMSLGSTTKTAPPPPARKAQPSTPIAPQRVRELSEGISAPASPASRTSLLPPTVRMRTASGTSTLAPPPSRTAGNGNASAEYSGQRFEVEGFPAPREFREGERRYLSGRERGSEFML